MIPLSVWLPLPEVSTSESVPPLIAAAKSIAPFPALLASEFSVTVAAPSVTVLL